MSVSRSSNGRRLPASSPRPARAWCSWQRGDTKRRSQPSSPSSRRRPTFPSSQWGRPPRIGLPRRSWRRAQRTTSRSRTTATTCATPWPRRCSDAGPCWSAPPAWCRTPTPPSSSRVRPARARSCSPGRCTTAALAPQRRSWNSTAPPCRLRCSRASCSATSAAPSPTRRRPSPACSRSATAARTVDVRIVAATNTDLAAAVHTGDFREDLYYRLNVITLHLPPLRERGEDVIRLAEFFLDKFATQYKLARPAITPEIRRALLAHAWPGNIRELRNAVERAVLLSPPGTLALAEVAERPALPARASAAGPLPFPATLAEVQRAAARAMLNAAGGNRSEAARRLGISRSRLQRLLEGEAERDAGEDDAPGDAN